MCSPFSHSRARTFFFFFFFFAQLWMREAAGLLSLACSTHSLRDNAASPNWTTCTAVPNFPPNDLDSHERKLHCYLPAAEPDHSRARIRPDSQPPVSRTER
ncbi:hypothetical protein QBC46DRAFT_385504 [Diplogelasinospora grovesii]|uniref:Secreted protein n=1 Tax=Diplogelasinospora grovesii TaxID=303347 RepID=A0AAN6S4L8_9PEZI|nr:hypothetical protein QBC46DRAFT_385504 [Diplogelasinospora grovesii]